MKPLLQSLLSKRLRFTLIEMVSAIGIMALIISITVIGVRFAFYINSDRKSRAVFKQLEIAFDQYFADYHCYPPLPEGPPINYKKDVKYVPLGEVVVTTTATVDSTNTGTIGSDTGTDYTITTATATVPWTYYTTSGQYYYNGGGTSYQASSSASKVTDTASFFRATLNHPPNNYNPYIEDALTPTNVNNYTMDGFGQPIYYKSPGLINTSAYDLWSAGADGYFGLATETSTSVLHVYGSDTANPQVHIPGGDPDDYVNWRKN